MTEFKPDALFQPQPITEVVPFAQHAGNPPIPTMSCAKCGGITNETLSIYGVMHLNCYQQDSGAVASASQ